MHRFALVFALIAAPFLRGDEEGWIYQGYPEEDISTLRPLMPGESLPAPFGGAIEAEEPETLSAMSSMSLMSGASAPVIAGNAADYITPEIQALADSLGNDPARIFEHVYNSIEYEHYYGSKKGAHLTLLEGKGNDADQAALFVALLRAAGHSPTYRFIACAVPYDETVPPYANATEPPKYTGVNWLGLAPVPYPGQTTVVPGGFTGWTETGFEKSLLLRNYFLLAGYQSYFLLEYEGCILVYRYIVALDTGDGVKYWDPSAKKLKGPAGLDLLAATGFNKTDFLTDVGGTVTADSVKGLDMAAVKTQLSDATNSLLAAIRADRPNATFGEVIGRQEYEMREFEGAASWMPFDVDSNQDYDMGETIPAYDLSFVRFQINSGTIISKNIAELRGRRLSVGAIGNTVQIRLDDEVIHSATVTSTTYTLAMAVRHPLYVINPDGTYSFIYSNHSSAAIYKKSADYALTYGFSPGLRFLRHRQSELDGLIDIARSTYPAAVAPNGSIDYSLLDATLRRKIVTENLNVIGANWQYQTTKFGALAATLNDSNYTSLHKFGRIGQEAGGGLYIDMPLIKFNGPSRDGLNTNFPNQIRTFSYFVSGFENGIIEQHRGQADHAVSTVQMLHLANVSTDPDRDTIYRINTANWSSVSPLLVNYGTLTDSQSGLYKIKSEVDAGVTVYAPKSGDNSAPGWEWSGYGIIGDKVGATEGRVTMTIAGSYSGGYSIEKFLADTGLTAEDYRNAVNWLKSSEGLAFLERTTSTDNVPGFTGADPVDMATGAMVYNKEDLSLGQGGVRGLSFQRHYSSDRRKFDGAKLGYGWTHNYDMHAAVRTAAEAGLGDTTPYEAAQMIAATFMVNELAKDAPSIKPLMSAIMLTKVAVDNLLNNGVSLTMGNSSLQFVKQPDGSYTAPAGSTMTLSPVGDFFHVTERFGNTYKFDMSDGGRIAEIEDFFGKTLTFAYTSDGLHTVTDAYSRTLTLGYTSGLVSSVTDSTGRSVQFGHTNGTLTTAIDPENKTWTFGYDTERRLEELIDPEDRTVLINRYNIESRVYEQDLEGDPTKTWKLSFTGLRNTEADPLGGEKVYFYDRRGRPTGVQDALGNRVRMVYDGQDHMVERHTPKNEVYKQVYDADHNLAEAENPIGAKVITIYDSLHRPDLITVHDTDPLTADRVTDIDYDQGSLTALPNKITDPKGNIARRIYYPDGNLQTATEESITGNRTTTYYYDARGMPETITYPDNVSMGFVYNVRGDLSSLTDRKNNTTSFLYNDRRQLTDTTQPGNRITQRDYGDSANLETVTDAEGNVVRFTYSPTGKTLTQTAADGTPEAETVTHFYDERDWLDYTLDPRNQKTDFEYDAAGRVTSILNPLLHETSFEYDANGQRTLVRTPLGHETQLTYTSLGQKDTVTDPAGNLVDYGYNAYGERNALKNRRDNTFEFSYDANGNPTITETPLNHAITRNWSDRNLIESIEEASGQTATYVHDHLRRVYSQVDPVGTIIFDYDDNGNPETVTEGTSVLTRTWDALNRPESYTNARNETIGYQYYDNGLLWKLTYPGNRVVTYTYYPTNRLKTVQDWAGRMTTYMWDTAGRLTGIARPNGVNRTNAFDNANRLESIHERDNAGRLLLYFKYGFDDDGQITSRYRLPKPQPMTLPTMATTYDADNRVDTWNSQSLTHDDDGNMISGPLGALGLVTYNYDARNRLTSVGTFETGFTTYGYDAENNRVSVTTSAGVTRYLIDPHGGGLAQVLVREKPDTSTITYVYGIGLLYEVNDATGDATYYHYDNNGNTVAITGPTGALTDRIEYSGYGQITHRVGTTDTPFLYVGQFGVQADANGLLYMRARYYSSELHRFLNADPIGFGGGLNWYAYANGNPVSFADASGLDAVVDYVDGTSSAHFQTAGGYLNELYKAQDGSVSGVRYPSAHGNSTTQKIGRSEGDSEYVAYTENGGGLLYVSSEDPLYNGVDLGSVLSEKLAPNAYVSYEGCETAKGDGSITEGTSIILTGVEVTGNQTESHAYDPETGYVSGIVGDTTIDGAPVTYLNGEALGFVDPRSGNKTIEALNFIDRFFVKGINGCQ